MRPVIVLALLFAGCTEIPQRSTAKVCITDSQGVGSTVWITEFSGNGTVTEVLGPSRECRNPALPILAIAKAS